MLPEGHQSNGDGLQERPDGGCELWGEASKSGSRGGQGSGGAEKRRVEAVTQQMSSELNCVLGTGLGTSWS